MMVTTTALVIRIDMILSARAGKKKTFTKPRPTHVDVYSRLFLQWSANCVSPAAETTAGPPSLSVWSVQIPLVLDTKCIGSAREQSCGADSEVRPRRYHAQRDYVHIAASFTQQKRPRCHPPRHGNSIISAIPSYGEYFGIAGRHVVGRARSSNAGSPPRNEEPGAPVMLLGCDASKRVTHETSSRKAL